MNKQYNGIILEASGLSMAYGDRVLFEADRLCIYEGDRIGLIGENGAGKSTLMRILYGEIRPEAGMVERYGECALIRQMGKAEGEADRRMGSLFRLTQREEGLSGGEKTRRRIAAAFSRDTVLLFADEPTTDLDRDGIETLKKHLLSYPGALLLISHDRALLNRMCNKIWYLNNGRVEEFFGNYDDFQQELQRQRDFQQFEYEQYVTERDRLQKSIQKQNERSKQVKRAPSRMGNSEARLHRREATDAEFRISRGARTLATRLEQLEKKERPKALPEIRMSLGAGEGITAKNAITLEGITLRAGDRLLLQKADMILPVGKRTALLGPNGCGKTSLLKALCGKGGEQPALEGKLRQSNGVRLGWFDQDHAATLAPDKSALQNALYTACVDEGVVRTVFARVNMRGDSVYKPVSVLSGGERAKTALVKLLVSDANVLILDEPTNHLDVFTMEALEQVLCEYQGTLLFVSHDAAFTQRVAQRMVRFEEGRLITFEGGIREMEASAREDRNTRPIEIQISALEMRLAALSIRLSAPRRGDDPLLLNEEYIDLSREIQRLKRML